MFLLVNDEYGQEVTAVYYDETTEKFKDVFDAARKKYPDNAFTVSSSSATTAAPEVPEKEPTAEEKKAAEKAKLASEYEANKSEMLNALQSATLAGNTDAVASIQQDYKDMTAAYKEAVEGVATA